MEVYKIVNFVVYLVSISLAMIGLSCFRFEDWIKKSKIKEFYIFYIMMSIIIGYLFGTFLLNFGRLSFYA